MLCGEFYFGPHVSWLFSEASTLIHLHTDAREDCPELDALLNILVRESLAQRPGGSAIVRSLGDTLLVLLLRMLLGEQQPPGGLLRLMSDERLMPAVLAVMATPEQPWTLESMAARAFLSRATFARHFARVYHLTPQAWLSQLRMALAARLLRLGASDQPRGHCRTLRLSVAGFLLEALQNALWRDAGRVATGLAPRVSRR